MADGAMNLCRAVRALAVSAPLLCAGCGEVSAPRAAGTAPRADVSAAASAAQNDVAISVTQPEPGVTNPTHDIPPQPAAPATIVTAPSSVPDTSSEMIHAARAHQASVAMLCEQIGNKLGSVSVEDCAQQDFVFGGGFSVNQRPLVIKDYRPANADGFRVLIMGGIHGDEYSSISILFKWLARFSPDGVEGSFHWRFAPLVNPDGLLDGDKAKRQNANGVDLNRNFPSRDWSDKAVRYWQESTGRNPRRFPGEHAASEPEVQWVVKQIEEFQPDVIVSVHAPYHLLDFDGPAEAPSKIGELYLNQLGVYPGSLGNFAGINRAIPVVTLELPSAGIMPPAEQIDLMWKDLVAWLDREGRKNLGQL